MSKEKRMAGSYEGDGHGREQKIPQAAAPYSPICRKYPQGWDCGVWRKCWIDPVPVSVCRRAYHRENKW